jgi:hypothetical protein
MSMMSLKKNTLPSILLGWICPWISYIISRLGGGILLEHVMEEVRYKLRLSIQECQAWA